MKRFLKVLSIAVASLVAAVAIAWLGFKAYARTDSFRARMQAVASKGMGMQVSLEGPMDIGLFPSPNVTLHDVHVHNRGVEMGAVDAAYIRFRWWPLLRRDAEVETVSLIHPHILIVKGADGTLDLVRSTPPVHKRAHGPIEVTVTGGIIRFEQAKTSQSRLNAYVDASDCDAQVHDIYSEKPDGRRALERLSFSSGEMGCKTVTTTRFTGTDLHVTGTAPGKGVFSFQPITLTAFGAKAAAAFSAKMAGDQESYAVKVDVPGVHIERMLSDLGFKPIADGQVDLAGHLAYSGSSHKEILRNANGALSFHGQDVTLNGYDLDKELTRFERTQRFDLADLLGLFVGDGTGILATKGVDYAQLIKGRKGGVSHVHEAVVDLGVSQGVVHTEDVAASTDTHRIAAQGKLDLTTDSFDHVTLALVDAKGCPIAEDQLGGSIRKPKIKNPGVIKTLTGPVRRIVNKGKDLFTKQGCSVFYDGSVRPY